MTSDAITIINKLGLHARASAKLVSCASGFQSKILIEKNGQTVDGKSIMGVMMLAAAKGSQVIIHAEGEDDSEAITKITELINERFGEAE